LTKPKICFLALSSYPTLAKTTTQQIGGAEVQQILIAKELIKTGFDISFIVHDYSQKPVEVIDGITVYKIFPVDYNIKGAKSLFMAVHSMWKALKRADADIYYQRAANAAAGTVALFCILKKKKYVQSLASDKSLNGTYRRQVGPILAALYNWALKKADAVIVQSQYQQELLKKEFCREGELIKSGYILPDEKPKKFRPPLVLWVSTLSGLKQAELFAKLAKENPSAKFQMIGGPGNDAQYYEEIKKSAIETPNLDFLGFVPYQEVNPYFERAAIFVNTSTHEGFPNTFLQAWANYTPVVSLNVDPDEIICNNKLGFHSKTFEQMLSDVKRLLSDERLREEMGVQARQYIVKEHNIMLIAKKYERLFEKLTSSLHGAR
jgi:glycosyltransferase involved in cell wall biosynthesis